MTKQTERTNENELKMVFLPSRIKEYEEKYGVSIFGVFSNLEAQEIDFKDLFNLVGTLAHTDDEDLINDYFIKKTFSKVMKEVADGLTKTGFLR